MQCTTVRMRASHGAPPDIAADRRALGLDRGPERDHAQGSAPQVLIPKPVPAVVVAPGVAHPRKEKQCVVDAKMA